MVTNELESLTLYGIIIFVIFSIERAGLSLQNL